MRTFLVVLCGIRALLLAGESGAVAWPANGTVGVYTDAAATQWCITAPAFVPVNTYLIATTAGATANGISGAEFRIEVSNPTGYIFQYSEPVANHTVIGINPLDLNPNVPGRTAGFNIAFQSCQGGSPPMSGDRISLGTITIVNLGTGGPTCLQVKKKLPPSNPDYAVPLFTICDSPNFTKVAMTPTEAELGGVEGVASASMVNDPRCTTNSFVRCDRLPVTHQTWSGIKDLYRNP